jgi:phage shock protein PspC (stress-responsive transcriptional regulator)
MDDFAYLLRRAGIAVLGICAGLVVILIVAQWVLPRLAAVLSAFVGSTGGIVAIVLWWKWMNRNRGG